VGYNGRKTTALWNTTEEKLSNILRFFSACIPQWKKISFVVVHKGGKHPSNYPTTHAMLLHCIPQPENNLITAQINFSAK
jgi:hypothetical protein